MNERDSAVWHRQQAERERDNARAVLNEVTAAHDRAWADSLARLRALEAVAAAATPLMALWNRPAAVVTETDMLDWHAQTDRQARALTEALAALDGQEGGR